MSNSRQRRRVVNGIVLVDKPVGMTSAAVVKQVIKAYRAKKAGHTGTLDPFATGLLPVCLGEATKVSSMLLASDKRYIATLDLGHKTDTGDRDGEVIDSQPVPALSAELIEQVLASFRGEIAQTPPMYSSIKFEGKSLHVYARKGIEIEREPRQVTIYELDLIDFNAQQIRFEVHCSKGTYIRVLGAEIAEKLGTVGHLSALHRTQTGIFNAHEMRPLQEICTYPNSSIHPLDIALLEYPALYLTAAQKEHLWLGGFLFDSLPEQTDTTHMMRLYDDQGMFFAMGEWQADKQRLKIKRGFRLNPDDANALCATQPRLDS
ncbi:tRNA pseudouridine(55) synthase TruB [Thiomicrospira sp. ALE5]|uniref:tRNA pseudouridine(55) synthase TruB n=1 Tax=Thiomicrospira sp. ALE5 TaxID=748650 RepID=UPI0008EED21F|nr:tRNA pseudouridine(55) synthase TruB [Thiomicrospira sp. ALE5]SFR49544.1 tRNA pseudouridine55 synthase [Thiomicrospira sp. ALE5]